MCKGLAIVSDKKGKFFSCGLSSHTETIEKFKLKEDESLKFEVIIDDSQERKYLVQVDEEYRKHTEQGKESQVTLEECKKWILENETEILRQLLFCNTYKKTKGNAYNSYQETKGNTDNSYQKTKGNTDNSCQKTEGNTDNSYQKTKGNTYNSYQKTKGNTYNRYQKTGGNTYNSSQETKGDTDNRSQKTEGDTYNSCQETKGDTYNSYQKTKGNTDNISQETEGDTDNSSQKTKGEIFCEYVKNNDVEVDNFITKISDELRQKGEKLTWKYLVRLAMKK